MINSKIFFSSLPLLLKGILINIEIAFFSFLLGFLLSIMLAMMQRSKQPLIKLFSDGYILLFRGTPMLVQIMFIYYILPQMGLIFPPILSVVIAIGLNSAAYLSQIVYTGLEAISKSQYKAGHVLGMNTLQIYKHILLPQALRKIFPALGNEIITLLKDSSLASIVGIVEIVKVGAIIRGRSYEVFTIFLATTLIYLCLTTTCSFLIKYLEKWSKKPCLM